MFRICQRMVCCDGSSPSRNRPEPRTFPLWPRTLIVPPTQLIYAGQTMDVTISATSIYPDPTFTYAAFASFGPPYLDVSDLPTDGVLKWTPRSEEHTSELQSL